MKPSSKDEVAGKIHEVKGAVKEKAGKLANNPALEADGKVEKVAGRIQKKSYASASSPLAGVIGS